jgi:hypothetical protein
MKLFLSIGFAWLCFNAHAQENYIGSWLATTQNTSGATIKLNLEIGQPERNLIFPAKMTLTCDAFTGVYYLLLVKKGMRQLVISTNKSSKGESPFSIGNATWLMNGTLDFYKDLKGQSHLSINRIKTRKPDIDIVDPDTIKNAANKLAIHVFNFLGNGEIDLVKNNETAWNEPEAKQLLQTKNKTYDFGLIDTVFVRSKFGSVKFESNKDIDIISVGLNQQLIVDQVDSKKKRDDEDFILDTGLNLLVLYADDFGKSGNSSAAISVLLDNTSRLLSFNNPKEHHHSFLILKILNQYRENDETGFQNNPNFEDKFKDYPIGQGSGNTSGTMILNRPGKVIGSIASKSQTLTFALWDDAVEDGDSISLNINGRWITRGFPVKKQPQFITITLDPGPNVITFVADNLGSIIPNTSVLEIIDGNRRKSFNIETDMNENNQVKIFYEVKPK